MRQISSTTVRWTASLAVLVLWETLPRLGLVPELFLPPLSRTVFVLATNWQEYAEALGVTLVEVCAAGAIACGGGILSGAVIGSVPTLRTLLLPLASGVYAVPIVILYPILTVWCGIGPQSKIAFAAIYGFFPTMLAAAAGIRTIDASLLLTARSMGATLPQRVLRVILPAAMPTVFAGVRLGGALVIVGVVVAEMLTSTAGIGYLVSRYRTILASAHVYAAILCVLLLGVLFDTLVRFIERRVSWQLTDDRRAAPVPAT
jgi:NitT/TauT family transport system permease protein